MHIREVTQAEPAVEAAVSRFVFQLTGKTSTAISERIKTLLAESNSHLFIAEDDNSRCLGMITVGFYTSPTGKKAWIEDVVVDETSRGLGIGKELVRFAMTFAEEEQADALMLTSNPARIAANKLYQSLGFERKETNVYRITVAKQGN